MVRQQMKLAAVLAVVVLALTGFSTSSHGHGHSGSSHGSGSGGGCSNSHKSNGYNSGSTTDDYDDDDYGSGSSSGSTSDSTTDSFTDEPTPDPTAVPTTDPGVRVLKCAHPADGSKKAVASSQVELSPVDFGIAEVDITVTFSDSATNTLDTAHLRVELDASASRDPQKFTVPMTDPSKLAEVYDCNATAVLVG
ncbi:hypothetical protein OHT52_17715 [Streptomyces sp. NBC_00247]|uniref:hypothetical protein n=1 Tax=Streptomyces sp. NBC_00247 TaxID=2975689 RepID=UPI002E291A6C|nr:hypothetical protein [Streptomyces sp. NBC_00247]